MTDKCSTCDNRGWVCENHRSLPSATVSSREDACNCGPGVPCPECVLPGEFPEASRYMAAVICSVGGEDGVTLLN